MGVAVASACSYSVTLWSVGWLLVLAWLALGVAWALGFDLAWLALASESLWLFVTQRSYSSSDTLRQLVSQSVELFRLFRRCFFLNSGTQLG